jgi:hypothetical protein
MKLRGRQMLVVVAQRSPMPLYWQMAQAIESSSIQIIIDLNSTTVLQPHFSPEPKERSAYELDWEEAIVP